MFETLAPCVVLGSVILRTILSAQRSALPHVLHTSLLQATQDAAEADSRAEPFSDPRSGVWKYVVGLVGKPSAGKSTFFNAITDPLRESDAARVAAYPFTTIDPNIAQGE